MLTARQSEVLSYLVSFISERGYPPTIREVGEALRMKSSRSVVDHLRALERKGYIRRDKRSSRAIEVLRVAEGENLCRTIATGIVDYPVAGRIEAGQPAPPIEDCTGRVSLDVRLFAERGDFILEVEGDSMIEEHIVPGDLLVVRRVQSCKSGDIIVAMVNGETTVKRYVRHGARIILQPANRKYKPVLFKTGDPRQCSIIGKVLGIIRRFDAQKRSFSG